MDVRPVNKKSVHEDIVLQIRAMIDRGELRVGDRLPPERRLAEMFFVARNTVREAIRVLSESNLLESRQGAGTFVKELDGGADGGPSRPILQGQRELQDVFEVRKLMEPEIAALAARNASPSEIMQLEAIVLEQEAAVEAGEPSEIFGQRFHELLAETSGNTVLGDMVAALHDDLVAGRPDGAPSPERAHASLDAHRAIVDAVKGGHIMQAERAMREHLDEIETILLSGNI